VNKEKKNEKLKLIGKKMEGDHLHFWDVVGRYPFGSLVIALSLIWSVERVTKAIINRNNNCKRSADDEVGRTEQ
jgi:hypothetical protein